MWFLETALGRGYGIVMIYLFRLEMLVYRPIFVSLILVCVALLLGPAAVSAADNFQPYVGRVPAPDVQSGGLSEGFRQAFIQVLTKLTGSPEQVLSLARADQLGPVAPLVMVHRFGAADAFETQQRWLEVQFDSTLTNDRLRDLRLPVWPLERPETLVWVALEREGRRVLLGTAETDAEPVAAMELAASTAGIPLVLPLMDLDDQQRVRVSDVWGGFADNLAQASERYSARQLLLGRSYADAGGWNTRWLLNGIDGSERWESRGQTLAQSLAGGVAQLAISMAGSSAITSDEIRGGLLLVRIHGVSGAADYGQLIKYLNGLSMVERVQPVSVFSDTLDLNLSSNVGLRGLQQALAAGRLLRPRTGSGSGVDLELQFQD